MRHEADIDRRVARRVTELRAQADIDMQAAVARRVKRLKLLADIDREIEHRLRRW